jgi:hypothetical protein
MVEYRKAVTFSEKEFQIFTKPLNICSDFHLGRHFFGLVGGFFVGLSVTLWLGMTKDNRKNEGNLKNVIVLLSFSVH